MPPKNKKPISQPLIWLFVFGVGLFAISFLSVGQRKKPSMANPQKRIPRPSLMQDRGAKNPNKQ
jgi:hypothetical protein